MSEFYENQVVAFIDLLGFKEAVASEVRAEKIMLLLREIKNGERATGGKTVKIKEGGVTEFSLPPAISAFSDHIVISISDKVFDAMISWEHAIIEVLNIAWQLAAIVAEDGFLLRGGITCGKLYHKDGLIFGPALGEAFHLESSIAIYPRIVVSPELVKFAKGGIHNSLIRDADDLYYLNYLPTLLEQKLGMAEKISTIIRENISQLEGDNKKMRQLEKWKWFEEYFNKTRNAVVVL